MFTHDMEENRKSKVTIVDLDSDTVQDMIAYIYSGRVSILKGRLIKIIAIKRYEGTMKDLLQTLVAVLWIRIRMGPERIARSGI
jgi:hypothetical protein